MSPAGRSARGRRSPSSRRRGRSRTRSARPAGSPPRRSSGTWARSAATCSRRRAAGTGGSSSPAGCTAATAATRSEGQHREHAFFGNDFCASAHPSDPAAALLALGARIRTDRRELDLAELYRLPTEDDRSTTTLEPGELILELDVPDAEASVYLKAMDRKRWAFALVGVAAARVGGETRIALAGAAPVPWLLESPATLDDATPLPGTAYKVEIARALVAARGGPPARIRRRCACSSLVARSRSASPACGGDDDETRRRRRPTTTATTAATTDGSRPSAAVRPSSAPRPEARRRRGGADGRRSTRTRPIASWSRRTAASFTIELDQEHAPKTAASLVSLAENGFFDGTIFHRVVPGLRDPGRRPDRHRHRWPRLPDGRRAARTTRRYTQGVVAMAKAGVEAPGTSGSQFFVVTGADVGLPPEYAIVGEVTEGLDAVLAIDGSASRDGPPSQPVVIEKVTVSRADPWSRRSCSPPAPRRGSARRSSAAPAGRARAPREPARPRSSSSPARTSSSRRARLAARTGSSGPVRRCAAASRRSRPAREAAVVVLADGPDLAPATRSTASSRPGARAARRSSPRATAASRGHPLLVARSDWASHPGRRAARASSRSSCRATTSAPRATSTGPAICPRGSEPRPANRCRADGARPPTPQEHRAALASRERRSPLGPAARRRLTVEEAAKRSGLTPEQVEWLEQGRVYRFPSVDHALEAALLARHRARHRPARGAGARGPRCRRARSDVNPTARFVVVAALSAALMAIVAFVLVPGSADRRPLRSIRSSRRPRRSRSRGRSRSTC